MTVIPVILFGLAIAMGLWMAIQHFQGQSSPKAWGLLHGAFAVTGIIVLALNVARFERQQWGLIALGLFILGAMGGIYLFSRQLRGKKWPSAVIVAHGSIGITAFIIMVVWLTSQF